MMHSIRKNKAQNAEIMALAKKGQDLFFSEPPDLEASVAVFYSITELAPNWAEGFHWLGSALERAGQSAEAIKMFRKAAQLDAKDSRPFISLGYCFFKLGSMADAISSFRLGLELKPHYGEADARLMLGQALERSGKIQEAIAEWRKVAGMEAVYPSGDEPMIEAKAKLAQHKIEIR